MSGLGYVGHNISPTKDDHPRILHAKIHGAFRGKQLPHFTDTEAYPLISLDVLVGAPLDCAMQIYGVCRLVIDIVAGHNERLPIVHRRHRAIMHPV